MRRNFRELGAAQTVLAISKEAGVPLAGSQRELTPLQRMVLVYALEEQQEEMEEAQQGGRGSAGGMTQNSMAPGARSPASGTMSGDTVTYVNEGARDDG